MVNVSIYNNNFIAVDRAVRHKNTDDVYVILKGEIFDITIWITVELAKQLNIKFEEEG